MVYDADAGLVGEARYKVGHLLGRVECALCDISHGPMRRKAAFAELLDGVDVPVDVLHRNEQEPPLEAATKGMGPCVAARSTGGGWTVVVPPADLAACGGDVAAFATTLQAAPDRRR